MTRSTDVFIPLETRAKMANEIGADLFLSIHNNWVPNTSVSGTMSFYHNSEPSCRALALCIYNAVTGVAGLQGRGANSDRTLYANGLSVLRNCTVPSVLCEVAFLSNPADRNRLINEEFQQKIAQALVDGLRSYVEGSPSSRSAPEGDPSIRAEHPSVRFAGGSLNWSNGSCSETHIQAAKITI